MIIIIIIDIIIFILESFFTPALVLSLVVERHQVSSNFQDPSQYSGRS